jgi:hypothetical protein
MDDVARKLERAKSQMAARERAIKIQAARKELAALKEYSAVLRQEIEQIDKLPQTNAGPSRRDTQVSTGEGRVVLLLDHDNRGQKFMDNVLRIPDNWSVHVIFNPTSKHKFANKAEGDIRYHPARTNEKECNAALMALVAGRVAAENEPSTTTVYLAFCDEHSGRHEEVIERLWERKFTVETCSSWNHSFVDMLTWHNLNPEDYTGWGSSSSEYMYTPTPGAGSSAARQADEWSDARPQNAYVQTMRATMAAGTHRTAPPTKL